MYKRQIIKTATANRWNIPYRSGDPTILLTASGERMPVDGSAKIKARANGINVSMDVLVPFKTRCWSVTKTSSHYK